MASNGEIVKRKLFELRVVDLKAELESRNLDKTGVKAVLQERLQQALEKEGHVCDEYLFEVTESPLVKKPTKRTNKKFTRDDESETHSNLDESQNDFNLEDEDKMDSDEDRIDEKFFQVLETTEDTINLSIEDEEEKLLTEEDVISESEKQAECEGYKSNGKSSSEQHTDGRSRSPKCQVNSSNSSSTVKLPTSPLLEPKNERNVSINGDDVQREQEAEVSSGETVTKDVSTKSGDQGKSLTGSHNSESLSASGARPDESNSSKGEGGGIGGNVSSSTATKGASNVTTNEGKENTSVEPSNSNDVSGVAAVVKQEETSTGANTNAISPSKAKSSTTKEGSKPSERTKVTRPVASGKNLWVTGLSSATRATDLKSLFSKHGKVLGAKVVSNARSSVSRCYGFITMATAEEASKCIQHLHRTELHGRMISVERAKTDPLGPGRKIAAARPNTVVTKKAPVKKDTNSAGRTGDVQEKKTEESEKKEKSKSKDEETAKESSNAEGKDLVDEGVQVKESGTGGESQSEEKSSKKIDDRRESSRRSTRDSRERRVSERSYEHHRETFMSHRRPNLGYFREKFIRRPFIRRAVGYRPMIRRNTLTFERIRAERLRQRAREEEREMRDSERKRRMDMARQREIERRQREEAVRLERERERLRIEREKLERERAEVLRLEREKQKLERERIEREREELRRRERMSRIDEHRRPVKRSYDAFRGGRDVDYEDRKRGNMSGGPRRMESFERRNDHRNDSLRGGMGGRRDSTVPDRGSDSRGDRFERPVSRDTDLRGHGREDRSVSYRDSTDLGQSRQTKDDWKASNDRGRGHRDSGKGLAGNGSYGTDGGRSGGDSRYGERSTDSWHGNSSQSDSRSGGGSKSYNTSGGGGWSGNDRKNDNQWGGRNDGWGSGSGSGCGGIGSGRGQQGMGISQSMMNQSQSNIFDSGSGTGGGGSNGMMGIGMGSGGSSYNSDRFDSYKSMSNMRRY